MARISVKAGADIDLDVQDAAERRKHHKELISALNIRSTIVDRDHLIRPGNAPTNFVLYRCPVGMTAELHRLSITGGGSTPDAPYVATATDYLFVHIGEWNNGIGRLVVPVPTPAVGGGGVIAPYATWWGHRAAATLRSGEALMATGLIGSLTAALRIDVQMNLIQGVARGDDK